MAALDADAINGLSGNVELRPGIVAHIYDTLLHVDRPHGRMHGAIVGWVEGDQADVPEEPRLVRLRLRAPADGGATRVDGLFRLYRLRVRMRISGVSLFTAMAKSEGKCEVRGRMKQMQASQVTDAGGE